jgi:hypothetical protein
MSGDKKFLSGASIGSVSNFPATGQLNLLSGEMSGDYFSSVFSTFLRADFTQTCSNSNKTQINTNWNMI